VTEPKSVPRLNQERLNQERLNQEPGFRGTDAPAEADLYRCVHCGLCLSACPTYAHLGVETESPRGRIAFMKAVHEGRMGISDRVVSHWEMCLQCRACEAVCPSGVPYGRIMEYSRAQVLAQDKQGDGLKRISRLFLRAALPHPRRLRLGAHLIRAYQRSGLQRLVRASGGLKLLPGHLGELEAQLPVMGRQFFGPTREVHRAQHQKKLTVGLLSGCVMPLMQGSTMRAAVRVLTHNGCEVVVPMGQGCCGALNLHAGDLEMGRQLARRNIDVFLASGVDCIVTASAGCGSSMKEYHELLKNDPDYADKARRFSELTRDITEFLVSLPFEPPKSRLERTVTYQDPCHLAHAQRITRQPRAILKAIPGVRLVEMEQASMCCGSAGFYSLVQPDLAGKILDTKLKNVIAAGAEQVVTANPGCMMQIEMGLRARGIPGKVRHVVDLLDEAYQAETSQDSDSSIPPPG
jgi:glycolate oxidase iron-sulfur subunit